jgi:hypothetical protein
MPKASVTQEVEILRFFESAPLEKAEMLFNIVKEKMRARSPMRPTPHGRIAKKKEQKESSPVPDTGKNEGDRAGSQ